jgi:predicted dehydrogenase
LSGVAASAAVAARSRNVLGANDRIRIGLIGCGNRGNHLLGRVLEQSQKLNLEVSALCDVWKVNLEKTAERLAQSQQRKPDASSRFLDLLGNDQVDAVMIATPDFAHTPILIEATRAGKDAYVEKPMATRLDQAAKAVDLVNEKGTIVQVGTQRRSDPRYLAAAELMQDGILGTVSEVEAAWHDSRPRWARGYDDVRREDVDWEQFLMYLPETPFSAERFRRWHLFEDFTVGTPGLLGSHLIDVATWFLNDPLPRSAVAHGGVYVWKDGREHADTLDCLLEYPKGFLLNYSTRLGNNYPIPQGTDSPLPTRFYGTRGTFDTSSWDFQGLGGGDDALSETLHVPPGDREEEHVLNWLSCLRSRQAPSAPIETGYAHSVASILCYRAWKTGRKQLFNAVKREIEVG